MPNFIEFGWVIAKVEINANDFWRCNIKGGFRFCTKLGEYTTNVDPNILNTVTLAILVASFRLTRNKHSKFHFFGDFM